MALLADQRMDGLGQTGDKQWNERGRGEIMPLPSQERSGSDRVWKLLKDMWTDCFFSGNGDSFPGSIVYSERLAYRA